METLFNEKDVFTKTRPTGLSKEQEYNFYYEMATDLIDNGFSDRTIIDDVMDDLKSLHPFHQDGFDMANELNGLSSKGSYNCNTSFCEWLDNLSSEYNQIAQNNIKQWVEIHNPQRKYEVGTCLSIEHAFTRSFKRRDVIYVNGIDEKTASYIVDTDPNRKGGVVIPYEQVEEFCTPITTKEWAIEAMKRGLKVTHTYFSDNEWVTMGSDLTIVTEDNYRVTDTMFWHDRKNECFNTGWSIFKEVK